MTLISSPPAGPFYDQRLGYTIPYTVFATGIGWRTDMVARADGPDRLSNPYDAFWNPAYRRRVGLYDSYREVIGMALLHDGVRDVNTRDAVELAEASSALEVLARDSRVALTTEGAYEGLPDGRFALHQAWSGDILSALRWGRAQALGTAPFLRYFWPSDGAGVVGCDLVAVCAGAESPVLAHAFLNHLLDAGVALRNFAWNGYQPPIADATPQALFAPRSPWRRTIPSNLRSAVLERRGDQIHFNPRLLELAAHYHFVPRPCQVRAGNQKGRVERAIRYVRDSFWAGRVFTTLADCNRQALLWRDEVAHQRRWPDDSARSVAQAFAEEQPRLLPLPLHPFNTDRMEEVRSRKTIYVHFDLNDYSIPPEAVGRPLTLVASDTDVRILDGVTEIARHHRSYDRQQSVLDPAHEQALLRTKRKALNQTRAGRLALAVPESEDLLERAFAQGESAASQTAQLLRLLDLYGVAALRRAVREALERNTPRASSVAFLLRRNRRSSPLPALDLSRHPEAQALEVRPHDLETYDELAHPHDDDSEQ